MAKKKKTKKIIPEQGRAYVAATFNNTILTITDLKGQVITWGSTGTAGFKGSRQSTPFAATAAASSVAEKARQMGVRSVDVFVKGPGSGRDGAVRALRSSGLRIKSLSDITPMPHNGCRPSKRRRV